MLPYLEALAAGVNVDLESGAISGRCLVGVFAGIEATLGQLVTVGRVELELGACNEWVWRCCLVNKDALVPSVCWGSP